MNLCDRDHDEVCFEDCQCPMCELKKEHKAELRDLEGQIKQLEAEIEKLKEPVIAAVTVANEEKKNEHA